MKREICHLSFLTSNKAIGAVTELIIQKLSEAPNALTVELGFPRIDPEPTMYLLLYEIEFDPSLRNVPLDEGQPAPIWLTLKYLLTAYGSNTTEQKYTPYDNIGKAIQTLQALNYLNHQDLSSIDDDHVDALKNNPEPLKITFDKAPLDAISKILGTVNEKYQCSVCFQVRPVMITLHAMPSYSLLVGVDYTSGEIIGEKGVSPIVEIMGIPTIKEIGIESENNDDEVIRTSSIEFDNTTKKVVILGSNLDKPNLRIRLGSETFLPDTTSSPNYNRLDWIVNDAQVSAGSFPLTIEETKTENSEVSVRSVSNAKIIHFVPYLDGADLTPNSTNPDTIVLSGTLLGSEEDAITVAFYEEGKDHEQGEIVQVYTNFESSDCYPDQRTLKIRIPENFSGKYRLILRVNSQQARKSPEVDIPS